MSVISDVKVLLALFGSIMTYMALLGMIISYSGYIHEMSDAETTDERIELMTDFVEKWGYDVVNMTVDEIESTYSDLILKQINDN